MAFRAFRAGVRTPLHMVCIGFAALSLAGLAGCADSSGPPPVPTRPTDVELPDITLIGNDMPDVTDASDISDITDASDITDVTDVTDVTDASDASDVTDADAQDVAVCDASVCDASCVDLMNDIRNCGGCGVVCPAALPNTVATCAAGRCGTGITCAVGFADCDGVTANGCEVNTATSADNCGRCRNVCPASLNASAACVMGACAIACAANFGDCDGVATNGCEIDLRRSPMHCRSCGTVCTIGAETVNATPACAEGSCSIACNTGFANCNAVAPDGCEVNTQTDRRNCGGCGTSCDAPNATGVCTAGRCSFVCLAGFGDCDGLAGNGCEVDLNLSTGNCGRCGNVCPAATNAAPSCARGSCALACTGTFGDCNGVRSDGCEVELNVATENCGRCGNVCPGYANGLPACVGGGCRPSCNMGYGNCDSDNGNGCETDVRITATHCGVCGRVCPAGPNSSAVCSGSACSITCAAGFADCDMNPANGCEVNIATSVTNCGACGRACTTPQRAVVGCEARACVIASCQTGFSDCDGVESNGCETVGACPVESDGDGGSDGGSDASSDLPGPLPT